MTQTTLIPDGPGEALDWPLLYVNFAAGIVFYRGRRYPLGLFYALIYPVSLRKLELKGFFEPAISKSLAPKIRWEYLAPLASQALNMGPRSPKIVV